MARGMTGKHRPQVERALEHLRKANASLERLSWGRDISAHDERFPPTCVGRAMAHVEMALEAVADVLGVPSKEAS